MKKLINYLRLNKTGGLEFLIALYPIVSGYEYGWLKMALLWPILIDVFIVFRSKRKLLHCKPLQVFVTLVLAHELIWLFVINTIPSYYINTMISVFIYLITAIIVTPCLDYEKIEGAFNWVSLFCILGLFYHVVLLQRGMDVTPIKLPFLPETVSDSRLFEEQTRPSSFFWEPQAYVSYMLITLAIALINKRMVWAGLIALSMLLTSSTTALVVLFILFASYLFGTKMKLYMRLLLLLVILAFGIFYTTSSLTERGMEKAEKTDVQTSIRTFQGYYLVSKMEGMEYVFGIPDASVMDFYKRHSDGSLIIDQDGQLFTSGFWQAILKYGILGLLSYLSIYLFYVKRDRRLIPYFLCIFVCMFSNPDFIGTYFIVNLSFMNSLVSNKRSLQKG